MRLGCASRLQHNSSAHVHGTPGATYTWVQLLPPCRKKLIFQLSHISAGHVQLDVCGTTQNMCLEAPDKPWPRRERTQREAGVHSIMQSSSQHEGYLAAARLEVHKYRRSVRHKSPTQPLTALQPSQQETEKGSRSLMQKGTGLQQTHSRDVGLSAGGCCR